MTQSHTFILTDASNLFYRQIKMTNPKLGIDNMIGMALHLILYSMNKEWKKFSGSHVVMFLEGRSWRKAVYPEYKANRAVTFAEQSPKEQEDHLALVDAFDGFVDYVSTKTNISVVRDPNAEADDMIHLWVDSHPNDQHILISSDSDFFQLLRYDNFTLYDPVKDILIKRDGIFDDKGHKLAFTLTSGAKIKVGKRDPDFVCDPDWYNYALFLKCVRGDGTDNIFSAYPGVREKGTKNSIGIREAYEDRTKKGYSWNNFMLQKFLHHDGTEHTVRDDYNRNVHLIDLKEIPDNIKLECMQSIVNATTDKNIPALNIGLGFLKFCGIQNLPKIANNTEAFMPMLKAKYSHI